jgi:hypothetical protein
MILPQHNGSVYQHRSGKRFKETWLCLETDGTLTWKKKDAYQVKGQAYLEEILEKINIQGWTVGKCQKNQATPFIMRLRIQVRGSKSDQNLCLLNGADLDLWLDAFATVVGRWKLWRHLKERHARKLDKDRERGVDGTNFCALLKYDELVEFYKSTWKEFLASYKNGDFDQAITNGHHRMEQSTDNQMITPHRPTQTASAQVDHQEHKQQRQRETAVIVHQHQAQTVVNASTSKMQMQHQQNGTAAQAKEKEIFGEEDELEELHF